MEVKVKSSIARDILAVQAQAIVIPNILLLSPWTQKLVVLDGIDPE